MSRPLSLRLGSTPLQTDIRRKHTISSRLFLNIVQIIIPLRPWPRNTFLNIVQIYISIMNILQSIFSDYYEHIIYELHPRPAVIENISTLIHCGAPSFGGSMYGCSHWENLKFVPFLPQPLLFFWKKWLHCLNNIERSWRFPIK